MAGLEPLQQFLGAPVGMLATGRQQQVRDRGCDLVRTVMRGTTPMLQCRPAAAVVALEPLVAGLPADRVPGAELDHRVKPELMVINEAFAFFHR